MCNRCVNIQTYRPTKSRHKYCTISDKYKAKFTYSTRTQSIQYRNLVKARSVLLIGWNDQNFRASNIHWHLYFRKYINISGATVNCSLYCLEIVSLNLDDAFSHPWLGVQESKLGHALWVGGMGNSLYPVNLSDTSQSSVSVSSQILKGMDSAVRVCYATP